MSDTAQFETTRLGDKDLHAGLASSFSGVSWPAALDRSLLVLCSAIAACAMALAVQQTEGVWIWLCAGLFLPLAMFALRLTPALANAPIDLRVSLGRTLMVAGVLILVSLLLRLAEGVGAVDASVVQRIVGVMLGGGLAVVGYFLHNRLQSLTKTTLSENPALVRKRSQ